MGVDETRLARLRADLDRLVVLDADHRVFGVAGVHGHGYRRAPTRDDASLDQEFGALLPPELRAFLSQVHGGGAGPGYGLDVWAEPRASSPFPYGTTQARTLIERSANERRPSLPLLDDDDDDCWPPGPGFVAVAHHGCGVYDVVVVTGEQRGFMWCCDMAWRPYRSGDRQLGFFDWYEQWLARALAQVEG